MKVLVINKNISYNNIAKLKEYDIVIDISHKNLSDNLNNIDKIAYLDIKYDAFDEEGSFDNNAHEYLVRFVSKLNRKYNILLDQFNEKIVNFIKNNKYATCSIICNNIYDNNYIKELLNLDKCISIIIDYQVLSKPIDSIILSIIQKSKNLVEIGITNSKIYNIFGTELLNNINNNIKSIIISNSSFGHGAGEALKNVITSKNYKIEILDISNIATSGEIIEMIFKSFKYNKSITELNISSKYIDFIPDKLDILYKAIYSNNQSSISHILLNNMFYIEKSDDFIDSLNIDNLLNIIKLKSINKISLKGNNFSYHDMQKISHAAHGKQNFQGFVF